ncbi:hypothetical protein FVR03_21455 [Pontibacter qinzhouensis]|uniref:Uncharacterized protein n=1 Tax=Pontibacter qinzhouensis TaxID=2603253 RepID=A0A5C8IZY6_9BACT|nr:hypothetical protein [Pontibacter qinzhouensis]TXK26896.1 hypothetical protein FVR03_21455 [Pontibacter qinzhouensis]
MQELRKLLDIASYCEQGSFNLHDHQNEHSKESQLIVGVRSGKYTSDSEAVFDLYSTSDTNDVRYKMLKHRLKKKLFKILFLFDFSKTKLRSYIIYEQECLQYIYQAGVLIRQTEYDISNKLLNKASAISKKYDFTKLTVSVLDSKLAIEVEEGNLTNYLKIKEEFDFYNNKLSYETEAKSLYQKFKLNINKSVNTRKNFLPQIPTLLRRLEELWAHARTFETFEYYYRITIWYNELIGDFEKIIEFTKQVEVWLQEGLINEYRNEPQFQKFILVYAHLRAKIYDTGLSYAIEYKESFDPNFPNWFSFMENYLLLAAHARKYELAQQIIIEVHQNRAVQKITKNARERWALYKSYLTFLNHNSINYSAFNFQSFASTVPEYSKDKQGFNVAIIILQFMYFLQKGDSEALMYRIESLKKYILAHLKDSFSSRSKTFLKLLILTVVENFDAEECLYKGEKYYQKLLETSPPGDAYAEIEIIPYEHLWEHVIEILKNKRIQ